MKRNLDEIDFRAAFREEPESCHRALMHAARSVKEEKQTMKKRSMRTLLIAAVLIVSMLTTAFAAEKLFGWSDYFEHQGIHTTPQMQSAMQMAPQTFTVGPMTFTVQELVADPHMAMASTRITLTEGTGLVTNEPYDRISAAGYRVTGALDGLTDPKLIWLEAAQQLDLPLYSVRAIIEVDEAVNDGDAMEDCIWPASDSAIYLSTAFLKADALGAELPLRMFLRVAQIDPATGDEIEKWTSREALTLPVSQLLDEKDYTTEAPYTSAAGAQLTGIHADLYVTGAYLTLTWQLPDGTPYDEEFSIWEDGNEAILLTDGTFNVFEGGVSLSGRVDDSAWPVVKAQEMINVDALPEVIRVNGAVAYK